MGEDLESVLILTDEITSNIPTKQMYLYDVKDKQIIPEATSFYYRVEGPNYWVVHFITKSGEKLRSAIGFSCSIKPEDHHKVILRLNGESKRLFTNFASGRSCSTDIIQDHGKN